MEKKRLINILALAITFVFFAGYLSTLMANDVTLKVIKKWGKKVIIEMENETPVLGLEFTLTDLPDVAKVKKIKTTLRTKGFLAQFNDMNEKGVKVVLVSLRGKAILPGNGPILVLSYKSNQIFGSKKADLELRNVNIADINNQPVKANLVGTSF